MRGSLRQAIMALVVLMATITTGQKALAQDEVPEVIIQVAEEGLTFFKGHAAGRAEGYGFSSEEELQRLTLGLGYPIYVADLERARATSSDSLFAVLDRYPGWEFVVNLDGQPRTLLSVGLEGGQWKATGFGGEGQALGLADEAIRASIAPGERIELGPVVIPIGFEYFLLAKIGGKEVIAPAFTVKRPVPGVITGEVYPAGVLLNHLKTIKERQPGEEILYGSAGDHPTNHVTIWYGGLALAVSIFGLLIYRQK